MEEREGPKKPGRELQTLSGRVEREIVRRGTASEHVATVLYAADGVRVILQRIGGNAFDDPETAQLAGHSVRVEGYRLGDILRYTKAERLK